MNDPLPPGCPRSVRIVLLGVTHPGNIGAVARAMKTMCQRQLVLVRPRAFPCAEATARAAGADEILAAAAVHDSLAEALRDCAIVWGTSARRRRIPWPCLDLEGLGAELSRHAPDARVAILFGRESSGLSNAELEYCNRVIRIPANPRYASLNLAAAVQLVCYELLRATLQQPAPVVCDADRHEDRYSPLATREQMDGLYRHLAVVMDELGYTSPGRGLYRQLYRLFNRAQLEQKELNILRGLLSAVQRRRRC